MKKIAIGILAASFLLAVILLCQQLGNDTQQNTSTEDPVPAVVEQQVFDRFAEGSKINGINISGMLPSEAITAVEKEFESRVITVNADEKQYKFSYERLNCDYSGLEDYVDLHRPNESITVMEYDLFSDVDFSKCDFEIISGDEIRDSANATLKIDIENGTVEIVQEVIGNRPVDGVLKEKLTNAVTSGASEITLTAADYIRPEVLSDDEQLLADKAFCEKILNKKITIEVCGNSITLSSKKIRTMLEYDGTIKVNEAALSEYVDGLKSKYDTLGVPRQFTTSTGQVITIEKGTYGWIIDKDKTVEKIASAILNEKKKPSIKAAYTVKGQRPAGDEFQGTYIEVSIENQHVWMYKNGALIVDDDCTTGEWNNPSNHTREGMFFLKYKKRDVVLRGSDYADFVNYWMPYDKNIGMHDASWRTDEEFGGTNYIGNGSHGCVNLRHDTAETIYNNWDADIPIIVW